MRTKRDFNTNLIGSRYCNYTYYMSYDTFYTRVSFLY